MNAATSPRRRYARGLIVLSVLLLCVASSMLVASAAPHPTSAAAPKPPATPVLIDRALARGEISSDQRLLYLVYAVYDSSKLPAELRSRSGWSATAAVREINQARQALASGKATFSPELRAALRSTQVQAATVCNKEDGPTNFDSAHFRINHNASTINVLVLQDYVDALEATFTTEITTNGWAQPPLAAANTFGKYPVQIEDAGSGVYGYVTTGGGSYTAVVGDNPNTPAVETAATASCMVLNKDMGQFADPVNDPALTLQALKVTAGHEYFHAIQYANGDPDPEEANPWYESTAAYVEDEVLPTVHDNYQYLYPNLTIGFPAQPMTDNKNYSMWPLFRYAAERNGGLNEAAGGATLMKSLWANIGAGQTAITAYDNALQTKGSNLNDTFHNFAISLRFMKDCGTAAAVPYCFSDGANIVTKKGGLPTDQGAIATIGTNYTGTISNTYAANWISLPTSGTYSVVVNNTSTGGILHASVVADVGTSVVVTPITGLANAGGSITLASYAVPTGATSVVLVITNQAISADLSVLDADTYQVNTANAVPVVFSHFIKLPLVSK